MRLLHSEVQFAVHFQVQRRVTVPALGLDGDGQFFLSKLPLHEGRRNCVGCSGRIQLFAGAECHRMRGLIDRHGVGPCDGTGGIAEQESHGVLQFIQDGGYVF